MPGPPRKRSISYIIIKINDNIIKLDTSSYKKFKQELEQKKIFLESQFKIINQKKLMIYQMKLMLKKQNRNKLII